MSEATSNTAMPRPRYWPYWAMVCAILVLYGGLYGVLAWKHTAVPYFDQANYVLKVHHIAEDIRAVKGAWAKPSTYLAADPSLRPPLMMVVPAWVLGSNASPRVLAEFWLAARIAGLAGALAILARVVGPGAARLGPAIVLATLGSWLYLSLNPQLLMMDAVFTSFGFLLFAAVAWDMKRVTVGSAAGASLALLALVLIKPVGLALAFPMFVVLVIRNIAWLALTREAVLVRTVGRVAVFGLTLWGLYYLLVVSPYAAGVRWQYAWGQAGYWDNARDWHGPQQCIAPGWMLLLVAAWGGVEAVRRLRGGGRAEVAASDDDEAAGWLLIAGGVTLGWWFVFSAYLTYTFDARVALAALPITATVALVLVRRSRWAVAAASVVAAVVFVSSAGAAGMLLERNPLAFGPVNSPSPAVVWTTYHRTWLGLLPNPQRPVREIGLVPFMGAAQRAIYADTPAGDALLCSVFHDFVEGQSLRLALRQANGGQGSPIIVEQVPFADQQVEIESLLYQYRWFVTKEPRSTIDLSGTPFLYLRAMNKLLTHDESPLRGLLEARVRRTVQQPRFGGDEAATLAENPMMEEHLTLWRLTRKPTPAQCLAALEFVAADLRKTSAEGALDAALARVRARIETGASVKVIDAAAAEALARDADPAFRDIAVGSALTLRSVRQALAADGTLTLDLVWEAREDTVLDGHVFVHLLDAGRTMRAQADYRQDPSAGDIARGTLWRDTVVIPPAKMASARHVGLGVIESPRSMLRIRHGATDWDSRRLLVPLKR